VRIVRNRAYARAGLLGNPSDGYHGKTISIIVRNFHAEAVLYDWQEIEILPPADDRERFRSIQDLARDVKLHGYYGGVRLIKATIKRFVDYCRETGRDLPCRNFAVRYHSTIPRQVGLAGSSALVTATLRSLMEFYDVEIPADAQPGFILSVEQDELGITAGLQDRVIQVHEGMMYMDFSPDFGSKVEGRGGCRSERMDPAQLPPLYIAYHEALGEPTEVFHHALRERFNRGENQVVEAMKRLAQISVDGRNALMGGDASRLGELINENFDTRRSICELPKWQVEMVETARRCGATAKFAGSGGAIIGTFDSGEMYDRLCESLAAIGSRVIRPIIA
jgi:glucuronokinase